jgi:hypothetical protein
MKSFPIVLSLICGAALSVSGQASFDGPSQLPLSIPVQNWTSPNAPIIVGPSANLQAAINAAHCGDFLLVDPANVTNGPIVAQNCLGSLGITVQGNVAVDTTHRLNSAAMPAMPKIILKGSQSVSNGGNFKLSYFEVTRSSGTGVVYNLLNPTSAAHDVIYDHLWVHGTPTDETVRGLMLHGRGITLQYSLLTDFHCISVVGSCGDSQAVAGGINDAPTDGSYLLYDNDLQGAGENILFGGGADTTTPCDITILGNDISKPDSWNPADPSFVPVNGHPFIVKNLFELKNACRLLFDGNHLSGTWGGFSQAGHAILITPKNQSNNCPACQDRDITIRNTSVTKTCGALVMGFGPSDAGGFPSGAYNYSFHDITFTDLQYATGYQCAHYLWEIASGNVPSANLTMHDVSLKNITLSLSETGWLPPLNANDGKGHGLFLLYSAANPPLPYNIDISGFVGPVGNTPIYSTGGGTANCANSYIYTNYAGFFSNCWLTSSFTGNMILENPIVNKIAWPAGNYVVAAGAKQ